MTIRPFVVGIAGGGGSGKGALAKALSDRFDHAPILRQGNYCLMHDMLPDEERPHLNYDHPATYDHALMAAHLRGLRWGNPIEAPVYDFVEHRRRARPEVIAPARLILVEGMFLFAEPELREQFDYKIYLDTDADIRVIRRLLHAIERRGSFYTAVEQYLATARPMHERFVAPTAAYADRIVTGDGTGHRAESEIAAYIEAQLALR